jgi:hypothetical protein
MPINRPPSKQEKLERMFEFTNDLVDILGNIEARENATQSTFTVAPSNSCGVLNSLLSRPNAKADGIGTLKILKPFGLLKSYSSDARLAF